MEKMLINSKYYGTISFEMRWDCMNNNILISTAMLNSFWEKNKNDTIDLLTPFLKYSIAKTHRVGQIIGIKSVKEGLNKDFGFEDIPRHVIKIMLKRLSPKYLKRKNNEYYLNKDLSNVLDSINKKRNEYKSHSNAVAEKLLVFLDKYYKTRKYNQNNVLDTLIDFFVSNGICIIKDTKMLRLLKGKDDRLLYCIAQFIMQEYEEDSVVFSYIVEMVQGFFVSSSIYIQPDNNAVSKAKYKELKCYLDTNIVLNALGLKTEEEKIAANELLEMLKNNNAKLCLFTHNYEELHDIIYAYKMCREDPYNHKSTHTLEFFDNLEYSSADVDRYLSSLKNKIESLGVLLIDKPDFDEFTIDEAEFTEHIKNNITYRNEKALFRDVASVSAIYRLRKCTYSTEIERSSYIFVTSNVKLVNTSNLYFKPEIKNNVPLLITDMNLAAISWLKSYSTNKDYPKNKIIENSISCLEPSTQIVSVLIEKIDKLNAEGQLTQNEAAIYRTSLYCKKEVTKEVQGSPSSINDEVLLSVFGRFKDELKSEEIKTSDLNYQKFLEEREKRKAPIKNAVNEIIEIETRSEKRCKRFLWIIYWVLFGAIFLISAVFIIKGLLFNNTIDISSAILFGLDLFGLFDIVILKSKGIIIRIINKLVFRYKTYRADRKRNEFERVLGSLDLEKI